MSGRPASRPSAWGLRPGSGHAIAVAAAMALAAGGGCSAMRSRPPRTLPLPSLTDCSASFGPPITDVIFSGASAGVALIGFGGAALERSRDENRTVPSWDTHARSGSNAAGFLVLGAVATAATAGFVASAYHGFSSASACRKAVREYRQEHMPLFYPSPPTGYSYPPPYPPGWWPPPPPGWQAPAAPAAPAPGAPAPEPPALPPSSAP